MSYPNKLFGINTGLANTPTDYLFNYSGNFPITWRVYGTTLESFVVGCQGSDIHWGTVWLAIGY